MHHIHDIHDIKTWSPGALIMIDTHKLYKFTPGDSSRFVAVGMVVANDRVNTIRVLWPDSCKEKFKVYNVNDLNPAVIYHVR